MTRTLPHVHYGKCDKCGHIAEYYFSNYGSEEPCISCNAAPSDISKVNVTKSN